MEHTGGGAADHSADDDSGSPGQASPAPKFLLERAVWTESLATSRRQAVNPGRDVPDAKPQEAQECTRAGKSSQGRSAARSRQQVGSSVAQDFPGVISKPLKCSLWFSSGSSHC